jgi:hypothetical protein
MSGYLKYSDTLNKHSLQPSSVRIEYTTACELFLTERLL